MARCGWARGHACVCLQVGEVWDGLSGMLCKQQAVDVAYTHRTLHLHCLDGETGHILLCNEVGWELALPGALRFSQPRQSSVIVLLHSAFCFLQHMEFSVCL